MSRGRDICNVVVVTVLRVCENCDRRKNRINPEVQFW